MQIIQKIIDFVLTVLDTVLPVLNIPPEFLLQIDQTITFLIDMLRTASYFLPLDTIMVCFSVMIVVDNFALAMRIGQWIVRTIRG